MGKNINNESNFHPAGFKKSITQNNLAGQESQNYALIFHVTYKPHSSSVSSLGLFNRGNDGNSKANNGDGFGAMA
jgi:hypothetical protein